MSRSRASNSTIIHANAFHMAVAIEPVAEAVARIRASWFGDYERPARSAS